MKSQADSLTSGRRLAWNALYSLLGQGLPLLAALIAFPLLIKSLGTDRFGVLSLAWVLIGYFSLFDLGLGRALTKLVAEKLGAQEEGEIPGLVWTAMLLMLLLGVLGGITIGLISPWLVQSALKIPLSLREETMHGFLLIAVATPIVVSTSGLRGILEARQKFGLVNAIRIPVGLFTFIGPVLILPISNSLSPIIGVLVLGRIIAWGVFLYYCLKTMPSLRRGSVRLAAVGSLARFGAWMSVTNFVGPLMVYMDRFVVGAIISAAAVAYYATPYEVVTKLTIIASALSAVLFPAFAAGLTEDRERVVKIYRRGVIYLILLLFPPTLLIVAFAKPGLEAWLGNEFAQHSFRVMQWLAAGVLCNGLAQLPFAFIQGAGRPDLTARLHLLELPFYLAILWWMLTQYGIVGAAIAWTTRTAIDALALFFLAHSLVPEVRVAREVGFVGGSFILLLMAALIAGIGMKIGFVLITLTAFGIFAWIKVLDSREKSLLLGLRKKIANG